MELTFEKAFSIVLGGGLFGAACAAAIAATIWIGKSALINFFAAASDNFRSALKLEETRFDLTLKTSLDFRARQLAEFYWPLYIHLQKDNAVWDRILDRDKSDDSAKKVAFEIEKREILPNHAEAVKVIESKIHLAQPDSDLQVALMRYIRHVAVYTAMRNVGINDKDPIELNEPWPKELFGLIKLRTERFQSEFDLLIASTKVRANTKHS